MDAYIYDEFDASMHYTPVNTKTNRVISPADTEEPSDIQFFFLPHICCFDCFGMLYPVFGETSDFEEHLKTKDHRARVKSRRQGLLNDRIKSDS